MPLFATAKPTVLRMCTGFSLQWSHDFLVNDRKKEYLRNGKWENSVILTLKAKHSLSFCRSNLRRCVPFASNLALGDEKKLLQIYDKRWSHPWTRNDHHFVKFKETLPTEIIASFFPLSRISLKKRWTNSNLSLVGFMCAKLAQREKNEGDSLYKG